MNCIPSTLPLPLLPSPQVADKRHGYVKGLRYFPLYRDMDNETFKQARGGKQRGRRRKRDVCACVCE